MLKLSNWLYGLLLYSFPIPFRVRFGDTMRQTFRDQIRDALKQHGNAGVLELWIFTFFNVLLSALAEHKRETIEMPLQKLQRWSGPAIALGGGLWSGYLLLNADADIGVIVFLGTLPLIIWGLIGLYLQLPTAARPMSTLAVVAAVGGQLAHNVTALSIYLGLQPLMSVWELVGLGGFFSFLLGLAAMGVISLSNRVLDRLSFTPMLPAVIGLMILIDFVAKLNANRAGDITAFGTMLMGIYGISWLVLGFAMWKAHEQEVVQNQFA